jgi:hypothetical protein
MPTTTKLDKLTQIMGSAQRAAMNAGLRGEERQFFADKLDEYTTRFDKMPATYAQEGLGEDAVAHLHYFTGSADWWITEKDSDQDGAGQQQAFGLADLFQDGGELGYISLVELLANGAELDIHWTPKPLRECRKG